MGPPPDGTARRRRSPCDGSSTETNTEARRWEAPDLYGVLPPETDWRSGPARRCTLPSIRTERPMPSETDASAQPRSDLPDCRCPRSARQNPRAARSSLDPSSCGASSRSSSNTAWPGRDIRSKNRSSPTSCTGRERTSMAVPIRSFGSTPGGCATNCASSTRADPIPSSSRCRRAATCPSSKGIPPHPPTRLVRLLLTEPQESVRFTNLRRARLCRRRSRARALRSDGRARMARTPRAGGRSSPVASLGLVPRCRRGRLRCPRTATSSPSPGRATPSLARRISM